MNKISIVALFLSVACTAFGMDENPTTVTIQWKHHRNCYCPKGGSQNNPLSLINDANIRFQIDAKIRKTLGHHHPAKMHAFFDISKECKTTIPNGYEDEATSSVVKLLIKASDKKPLPATMLNKILHVVTYSH